MWKNIDNIFAEYLAKFRQALNNARCFFIDNQSVDIFASLSRVILLQVPYYEFWQKKEAVFFLHIIKGSLSLFIKESNKH